MTTSIIAHLLSSVSYLSHPALVRPRTAGSIFWRWRSPPLSERYDATILRRLAPLRPMTVYTPRVIVLLFAMVGATLLPLSLTANPIPPPTLPPTFERSIPATAPALPTEPPVRRLHARTHSEPTKYLLSDAVSTLRERAEDLSDVTVSPANPVYPIVQSDVVAEGDNAFHLAHPNFTEHTITLNTRIAPQADTMVFFESRLQFASFNQVARLQVSSDDGVTWTSLWSRTGTGNAGQAAFELVSVALGAYTGQYLHLRFHYEYMGGVAYTGTGTHVGWVIDDIQVGTSFIHRVYNGFGDPEPKEILTVEYINRARADAMDEAQRLRQSTDPDVLNAVNFFDVDFDEMERQFADLDQHVAPLAINAKLTEAARLHSEDMYVNVFQAHQSSSNPPAPNQPGDGPSERITRQGYDWRFLAENVYAHGESTWHIHAAFNIDWGQGDYGMQIPPGHRESIHNANFREIGVGIREGTNADGYQNVGPIISTQNFGTDWEANHPFLVGVTYVDANEDGFYSLGEGLGGVSITVTDTSFMATSSTHGAYAVPLPPGSGTYSVTFRKSGYLSETHEITVNNGQNVKLDYIASVAPQFILNYTAGAGGIISGTASQIVYAGEDGDPVTALPYADAVFATWSDGVTQEQRTDVNVHEDISVTAHFQSEKGADLDWYDSFGFTPGQSQTWSDIDDQIIQTKGTTLYEEYVADTNPNDPNDVFRCDVFDAGDPNGNEITLYFRSSINRLYTLQSLSELPNGDWSDVPGAGPRPGNGGAEKDSLSDNNDPLTGRYYRIKVTVP